MFRDPSLPIQNQNKMMNCMKYVFYYTKNQLKLMTNQLNFIVK